MAIPLLFALVLLGLMSPLQAQQTFTTGETIQLPSMTVSAADHATLATNSYGDVFIANHADHASGGKMVEGTAIASIGNHAFRTSDTLLLGDPSLNLVGADTCRKPDVEALGDGSFVVVWPRSDRNHVAPARLEAVRVVLRNLHGVLLSAPEVHRSAPGRGYLLDANVTAGDAGLMPDLVWLGEQDELGCAVVYAHEIDTSLTSNKQFREYELRCSRIDWSKWHFDPRFLDGPHVVVPNIPMDNPLTDPFTGGLILPDLVLDDCGSLVVAFEEAVLAPHFNHSGPFQSRIRMLRFESFGSVNPLQQIDVVSLPSASSEHRARRPNLSSSREDGTDSVSVTYGLEGLQGAGTGIEYKSVVYKADGVGGYRALQNAHWVQDPNKFDNLPSVADDKDLRSCFAVRQFQGQRKLVSSLSHSSGLTALTEVHTPIQFPWRPAAKLTTYTTPGAGHDLSFAAICYEGADTLTPSTYRIYFTYRQL